MSVINLSPHQQLCTWEWRLFSARSDPPSLQDRQPKRGKKKRRIATEARRPIASPFPLAIGRLHARGSPAILRFLDVANDRPCEDRAGLRENSLLACTRA